MIQAIPCYLVEQTGLSLASPHSKRMGTGNGINICHRPTYGSKTNKGKMKA